ncbi:hypothetical protein RR48_02412 [Papilio machaon]|uniref:Uncharacterized protein n=1 Tax=Papilio machaon TaxID=76193 RepID=A0A0N1IB08_PAPMA|nr:hypothetical protein RR48_02412 [Papilio machaon]
MGIDNKSYVKSEDVEMNNKGHVSKSADKFSYEEALDLTGHGRYNYGLLFACFMIIIAMGIDIFGLGIIATAATCDLQMTIKEIGILSSMPFAGYEILRSTSDQTWRPITFYDPLSVCADILKSSAAESATYALLGECCNSRSRARYMLLMTSALMLTPTLYYIWGYFITKLDFSIPLLGIVYRPWRLLTLVMALPLGIGALLLYFFSESPKFLANVGRSQETR